MHTVAQQTIPLPKTFTKAKRKNLAVKVAT